MKPVVVNASGLLARKKGREEPDLTSVLVRKAAAALHGGMFANFTGTTQCGCGLRVCQARFVKTYTNLSGEVQVYIDPAFIHMLAYHPEEVSPKLKLEVALFPWEERDVDGTDANGELKDGPGNGRRKRRRRR